MHDTMTSPSCTVILDIGDVLVSWSAPEAAKVSPKSLKRAMNTSSWFEFERGRISQDECYTQVGKLIGAAPEDVDATILEASTSLKVDKTMMDALTTLKSTAHGKLKLCLMSNMAAPHWDIIKALDCDWDIFDRVFISGKVGMRKPDLCFYRYVLEQVEDTDGPSSIVFVDDKLENVYSARSLGMEGIVFDEAANVIRQLSNIVGSAVQRGQSYLANHSKQFQTMVKGPSGKETIIDDNFAQLMILEATGSKDLVQHSDYDFIWNYCKDGAAAVTLAVPNDFDTTSLALTVLNDYQSPDVVGKILDYILTFKSPDGLILTYEDRARPRVDPICNAHIFTLFHLYGRSEEIPEVWNYLLDCLYHRAFISGSYYYEPPEYLLFSLSRLIKFCKSLNIALPSTRHPGAPDGNFLPLFADRCRERINYGPADALSLAMRLIACKTARIPDAEVENDIKTLKMMQETDGGWPWCLMYKLPVVGGGIGNRGVVTAMAVQALNMLGKDSDHQVNGNEKIETRR